MSWLQALERRAQEHHDVRALAAMHHTVAEFSESQGDLSACVAHRQRALELFAKTGDAKHESWIWGQLGLTFLELGDLQRAQDHLKRAFEMEDQAPRDLVAYCYRASGTISRCLGSADQARDAVERSIQLSREIGRHVLEADVIGSLGHIHLALGERQEALQRFQEAMARVGRPFGSVLNGLEVAYADPEAFRAFCHRFQAEHPTTDKGRYARWVQWFLEPAEPFTFLELRIDDRFIAQPSVAWSWLDPFGDCSSSMQQGLEIEAANGRDLSDLNLSVPRLLRAAADDFAVQTVCLPASDEKPAIGGLLLWMNAENYLRLDRGTRGPHEISFQGCLANQDVIIGRGRLPSERVFLRLERRGSRVNALCSADGESWFTVGHTEFPAEDPVQVGMHAIGAIDRTIYPGAYPDGTAIRFESFQLWS
jgi:tetratricopeptide (TPR) repeat protein